MIGPCRLTGPSSGYSSGPAMSVESINRNKPFKIPTKQKYGRSTSETRPAMSSEQSGLTTDQGKFSDTKRQFGTAFQSRFSSSPSGNEPHLRLTQQIPFPIGPPSLFSSAGRTRSLETRLSHSIESILSSSGSVQHKRNRTQKNIAEEAEGSNESESEEFIDIETISEEQLAQFGGTRSTSVFQKKN